MRVGITAHFQFSVFSGGGAASVFAVAEVFKAQGHSVSLINTHGTQGWWDDLQTLKAAYNCVNVDDVKEPFDLVLEVGSNLANKETRMRVGKHCVWVARKTPLLSDIEGSIFPINVGKRNLEGLTAVWAMDQEVTGDEHQYLETLARAPVLSVPFVWTPSLVEVYRNEAKVPSWIQVAIQVTQQHGAPIPWSVHIAETNNSASSSCTIPLVILQEAKRQNQFYFSKYKLHNAQQIEKLEYFKQNILMNCRVEGLSGEFLGRQRVGDWSSDPMSCLVAHLRFRKIRPYMLDCIWSGVPMIHNSPLLKELSDGDDYSGYYYEDNSIVGGAAALLQIQTDIASAKGMFAPNAFSKFQQKILDRLSPISASVQAGWRKAVESLAPVVVTPDLVVVTPEPVVAPDPDVVVSNDVNVVFTDMWDDFNPAYNMFLLIMQDGAKLLNPKPQIRGFSPDTLPADKKANLLIFGPFGTKWTDSRWSDLPKAHFSGENTEPVLEPSVFLNMAYFHTENLDERYIRLPLWMLEIDWFGCDLEKIKNPKPLPIDACLKTVSNQRDRFCAFVVTNPCNPARNAAFNWLSQYKKVDSAGRLYNNIGDEIFAGRGGGGGELKKHEFLKKYKFCLAYENAASQGYTTEKLLHAKAAGCVPIYWGDPKVERDFDTKGFIDARKFTTAEQLIQAVKEVDENDELYQKMVNVPALDEYKRDIVRRTLSQVAFSLLKKAMPSAEITQDKIPRFVGAATTAELGDTKVVASHTNTNTNTNTNGIVVLSAASSRFLPSVTQLLSGLQAQSRVMPNLEARVWLMSDVSETAEKTLKEQFSFARFYRFPVAEVDLGFLDYWNPQHFAWKLWLANHVANDLTLKGKLAMYLDSGIFLSRFPKVWLNLAEENGVCLLEDLTQKNRNWCHAAFCNALNVTEAEKDGQQVLGGCLAFKIGHPTATKLFADAYALSKRRDVIVGQKWEGVGQDGKPFGHRHDQSILSILSRRQGVRRLPMEEVYCDHSLRKTFLTGKSLYVHRGNFTVNKQFAKRIDDCYVINLDRRNDRMEKLFTHNPELKGRVERLSAVDGRTMPLTPAIARLFKPHDFFWKKAIMGCALSHLMLWWQLANEKPEIENYLILEDDVKLQPGWEAKWEAAAPYVPDDYDVVYLGGILPPNRAGFEQNKEKVNNYISRVAPNQCFGQKMPNRYFHWCNYAYVLSRKGAQKVLKILMDNDGYWTSGDHMVCNRVDVLNHYFVDPLVAGCYQDDDPTYQTSAFNNFNRVDKFDSDLWSNDERFTSEEVLAVMDVSSPVDIVKALDDSHIVLVEKKAVLTTKVLAAAPVLAKRSFVTLNQHAFDAQNAYERLWLEECIGKDVPFSVESVVFIDPPPKDSPIVIIQRPHIEAYTWLFKKWDALGATFYVLHLSDEYRTDSLEFYTLKNCLGIVRMYNRSDIPEEAKNKTVVIPLGYHWTLPNGSDDPLNKTPRLPFRNQTWSFFGTNWKNRKDLLAPLNNIQPNTVRLFDSWNSPDVVDRKQYIVTMLDTIFVPCPSGNNAETFRLYEALECGCIPLYVKEDGNNDEEYIQTLNKELGLIPLNNWKDAFVLMVHFLKEKELMENYRNMLLSRWKAWKERLGASVRKIWML